jgi:hypothetical protein
MNRSRNLVSTLVGTSFLMLAMGSGDEEGPSAPDGAGNSEVKVTEEGASPEPAKLECKEDITGKVGSMIKDANKAHEGKTDIQKEAHEAEVKKAWQDAGYCAKISGEVEDVKLEDWWGDCTAPQGMDGVIKIDNVDGVEYRGVEVFMSGERIKSDFADLAKGAKVEMEVYVYDIDDLAIFGTGCAALK